MLSACLELCKRRDPDGEGREGQDLQMAGFFSLAELKKASEEGKHSTWLAHTHLLYDVGENILPFVSASCPEMLSDGVSFGP